MHQFVVVPMTTSALSVRLRQQVAAGALGVEALQGMRLGVADERDAAAALLVRDAAGARRAQGGT